MSIKSDHKLLHCEVFVNENTTVKSPICVRRTAVVYFEEFFVFIMNPGATMTEIYLISITFLMY